MSAVIAATVTMFQNLGITLVQLPQRGNWGPEWVSDRVGVNFLPLSLSIDPAIMFHLTLFPSVSEPTF